eukprot:13084397-Alexandrium_andersonii.AAC.1
MGQMQGWQGMTAQTITQMQTQAGAGGQGTRDRNKTWTKDVSESKAIQGLHVFQGGDKGHYKEWHAKFVNVFTQ